MDKSLIAHAAFAIATSVAAYSAWKAPERAGKDNDVVVISGDESSLSEIRWREEKSEVAIRRKMDSKVEVTVVKRSPASKSRRQDGTTAAETASAEAKGGEAETEDPDAVSETFPGTDQAAELFGALAPLRGSRTLGKPSVEEVQSFGLTEPEQRLTLVFGGEAKTIDVGGATYGSGDLYARTADGEVFLLPSKTISKLRYGASSLLDRSILGLESPGIDRVRITHGAASREVMQRNAEDSDEAYFADPADPDVKLERLTSLIERVLRLRVTQFAEAAPSALPELAVEFSLSQGATGSLKVWAADQTGATVQSSRFEKPVRISRASADHLLRDINDVINEGRAP